MSEKIEFVKIDPENDEELYSVRHVHSDKYGDQVRIDALDRTVLIHFDELEWILKAAGTIKKLVNDSKNKE